MHTLSRLRLKTMMWLLIIFSMIVPLQMLRIRWQQGRLDSEIGVYVFEQPPRGEIYARDGQLLAGNKIVYEVGIDLSQPDKLDAETLAVTLSSVLQIDHDKLLAEILSPAPGQRHLLVKDFVDVALKEQLEALQKKLAEGGSRAEGAPSLYGLVFRPHYARAYPQHTLASNVLGFVNYQYHGVLGVEGQYDALLGGDPQMRWQPLSPFDAGQVEPPDENATLVLTIDAVLQAQVERILDDALLRYGARSGTIVVMQPRTGEILAMASTPRLDPNRFWEFDQVFDEDAFFNRAIAAAYEPGSVFKILTMAAALDAGAVQPDTTFLDTGVYYIGGGKITNWDNEAWGQQDMTGCLQHSLNVCLAWVSEQMGPETFYTYMRSFGLDHMTGIDLQGEMPGHLKLPGDANWYAIDLGTNSFGQGVTVTPIQMMMAASAIANDGRMVTPHVVYAWMQHGSEYRVQTQIAGQPIRPETAHTLNNMLANAIQSEASAAAVPGYRIAGKTGTAQISDGVRYLDDVTNASFIGWGPVDDPQFMIYVWLERPTASIWGSEVAAPIFHDVAEDVILRLNIPPDAVRAQTAAQVEP